MTRLTMTPAAAVAAAGRPQRTLRSSPTSPSSIASAKQSRDAHNAHPHEDPMHEDRGSGTSMSASSSREDSEPLTDLDTESHSSGEAGNDAQAVDAGTAAEDKGVPPPDPPHAQALGSSSVSHNASSSLPRIARPAYLYVDPDTNCAAPEEPTDDIAGVPVFTPTWDEFRDFYSYCERIDAWGMRSGIVKIIPPREWTQNLPRLDGRKDNAASAKAGNCYTLENRLSQVRIKNSIEQIFTPGGLGVWRQSNVVHPARIVNAKQWADTCASEGQRGPDMARIKGVVARQSAAGSQEAEKEDGVRTRSGRGTQPSQTSAKATPPKAAKRKRAEEIDDDGASKATPNKPKMAERTTQGEWDSFDYICDWCKEAGLDTKPEDWTPEVCRAIEQEYWRTLNYGKPPMYGADLAGTLFTDETKSWNVGKLDNLLTRLRLRRKLPGVTTPYLYFGMWRATFAWHVEDMDLYSINYIHFGAPKQWYAIRQADKQRFELAMANAFPADSNRCRQFMRHKSYLASPAFLGSAAGKVKPLRLVQHAQEFVITYPYGYHSGYNLGFNCAESVNFALESWLDIGRKAGYCDCTHDSVKMDVDAMLEESQEMEELERKRQERERRREEEEAIDATEAEKLEAKRARAREARLRRKEQQGVKAEDDEEEAAAVVAEAPRKAKRAEVCIFCPSELEDDLVIVPDGETGKAKRTAHRLCASFLPETWVAPDPAAAEGSRKPRDVVMGVSGIPKARWGLKCQLCTEPAKQKRGAKVQCTYGKCSRTSHVSCALEEVSGWVLDVLEDDEADVLEGRAAKAKKEVDTLDGEAEDADPRLVVLCHMHNPALRQQEARRKAEVLRMMARTLTPGQTVVVRVGAGTWETLLRDIIVPEGPLPEEPTRIHDDEVVAILADGTPVPAYKLIIPSEVIKKHEAEYDALDAARYERLEADAQAAADTEKARQEARDARKRARKAELEQKRLAREAKKAILAAEAGASTSPSVASNDEEKGVNVAAPTMPKPKRAYKKRKIAADAAAIPLVAAHGPTSSSHDMQHLPPFAHTPNMPQHPMHMMPGPHSLHPMHGHMPFSGPMVRPMHFLGPRPAMPHGYQHGQSAPMARTLSAPTQLYAPSNAGHATHDPSRMMPTPMPPMFFNAPQRLFYQQGHAVLPPFGSIRPPVPHAHHFDARGPMPMRPLQGEQPGTMRQ